MRGDRLQFAKHRTQAGETKTLIGGGGGGGEGGEGGGRGRSVHIIMFCPD